MKKHSTFFLNSRKGLQCWKDFQVSVVHGVAWWKLCLGSQDLEKAFAKSSQPKDPGLSAQYCNRRRGTSEQDLSGCLLWESSLSSRGAGTTLALQMSMSWTFLQPGSVFIYIFFFVCMTLDLQESKGMKDALVWNGLSLCPVRSWRTLRIETASLLWIPVHAAKPLRLYLVWNTYSDFVPHPPKTRSPQPRVTSLIPFP